MRIGTWNLERGGSRGARVARQAAKLATLRAEIFVLTEPHDRAPIPGVETVTSPVERKGNGDDEPWIAIVGHGVESIDETPYKQLAATARIAIDGSDWLVYGSVLPWRSAPHHAPCLAEPGESYAAMFERILRMQVDDMKRLQARYPDDQLIWAGDFNQSLEGPNLIGSKAGRALLSDALSELGLVPWNAKEPHAKDGVFAVDLICGPADRSVRSIERIDRMWEGRPLSDHAGSIVEV